MTLARFLTKTRLYKKTPPSLPPLPNTPHQYLPSLIKSALLRALHKKTFNKARKRHKQIYFGGSPDSFRQRDIFLSLDTSMYNILRAIIAVLGKLDCLHELQMLFTVSVTG
jgi:hypothetical protein